MDPAVAWGIRWIHLVAGITWIGLLYFFNLVNVRTMANLDQTARPAYVTTLLPRALAWFRHSAWVTVLAGLILIYFNYWVPDGLDTDRSKTITFGGVLGVIMLINVWVLIWPNQRKIVEATRTAAKPDPSWGRTALLASRTNFVLSFPMLAFMGGASHYPQDWPGLVVTFVILAAIAFVIVMSIHKWQAAKF